MNKISIIIPILNEAKIIGKLLQHLITNAKHPEQLEIIVVDGGSTDESETIVNEFADNLKPCRFIKSPKGRAKQMNTGAKQAENDILYFLHADSFPPKHFDNHIINQVKKGNLAGCFKMKFNSKHWWLKFTGWLTQFNFRACRGGDQSQFITKTLFKNIEGFNEDYTIYEDYDLINKLYNQKQFVVIPHWLITSARRYETNGIWKLQFHFLMIYFKKWQGASANELYRYYSKYIA